MNDAHDNTATDRGMLARYPGIGLTSEEADGLIETVREDHPEESGAIRMLKGALGISGYDRPSDRDLAMMGYSDELKRAILRVIEVSPVLEEAILNIAEIAFREGEQTVRADWYREEYQ